MTGLKLRTIHVAIIGIVASAIVIAGVYFLVIKKCNERIAGLEARYQAAESEWMQKAQVESQLEAAKQKYRIASWTLEKYLRAKMPPISFQDRAQGMIALWKEQAEVLGPLIQSWPDKTGVKMQTVVNVPAAPVDPNAIDTSLIKIPLGAFKVSGDFRSILAHIRSWNKFNRLVQIDPVTLTGPSPGMSAEYSVTVYIFPRGETGPPVTMGGTAAQAGGVPGVPTPPPGPT